MMEKRGRTLIGTRCSGGQDESDHGKMAVDEVTGLILLRKLARILGYA